MRQTVPHKRQVVLIGKRLANGCASSTMSIATSTARQGDHRQRVATAGRIGPCSPRTTAGSGWPKLVLACKSPAVSDLQFRRDRMAQCRNAASYITA